MNEPSNRAMASTESATFFKPPWSFVQQPSSVSFLRRARAGACQGLCAPVTFRRQASEVESVPTRRCRMRMTGAASNFDEDTSSDNDDDAASSSSANNSNPIPSSNAGDMTVYRKNGKRRPAGELKYDVFVLTPPERYLGRFPLDPLTHCGDILEHDANHFEVKVVKMQYRLRQGKYVVTGKSVRVKSLARKAVEVYLERSFEGS